MDKETERQAFLRKIEQGPWDDETPRLVYSDWLLERDEPEEAERQRNHVAAERWLRDFADQCGDHWPGYWNGEYNEETGESTSPDGPPQKITYEMVVDAGRSYVDSGGENWFVQAGSDQARDLMDKKTRKEFWRCWQVVTGINIPESMYQKNKWGNAPMDAGPFSCSC